MAQEKKDEEIRYFMVEGSNIGFKGGRYKGKSYTAVAKKAANAIFRRLRNNPHFARHKNVKSVKFLVRETTQGSKHPAMYYEAFLVPREKPVTVTLNGVEITYKHEVRVKSCEPFAPTPCKKQDK